MKTVRLNVITCALDSLLLSAPACEQGHKGLWFYSTEGTNGVEVEVGDVVEFMHNVTDVVAVGLATELVRAEDYPKFCSRVNDKGFKWIDCIRDKEPDNGPKQLWFATNGT